MSVDRGTPDVPEACRTCRFGQGDDRACALLDKGDQERLFNEGPCNLSVAIPEDARRLIRRRYPFARSQEEDLAHDALVSVLETKNLLVPGKIRHLNVLRSRLREVVRNAVIDALRRHKLVTRIRCGACVHFEKATPPPGCHLQWLPDMGTDTEPNPWYGEKVEHGTDPRGLNPVCDAFTWRRPETHDIFAEEIPGMDPEGTPRERSLNLLVQAIDRVASQDQQGLRVASALFWHYLRGRSVRDLASQGSVSEKTVKRLLSDGRERLLQILQDDFDISSVGELS
ncbi:MAG: hypothetical protein CMJ83_21190 [Planctomycetes bacterium]|nr:hypothetical protein [Planctomycetota bacterium]